jgi:uncharacterized membrane protein
VDLGQILATWLHTVAFVIAWGYYGILGRIVLPALEHSLDRGALASTLVAVERRALPIVGLSVVLFTVTGSYLLVVDPLYAGLGNFAASTWTMLMLVKHLVVIGLVLLAVAVDRLIARAGRMPNAEAADGNLRRLRVCAEGATGLGALIVLLTVAAQASR